MGVFDDVKPTGDKNGSFKRWAEQCGGGKFSGK